MLQSNRELLQQELSLLVVGRDWCDSVAQIIQKFHIRFVWFAQSFQCYWLNQIGTYLLLLLLLLDPTMINIFLKTCKYINLIRSVSSLGALHSTNESWDTITERIFPASNLKTYLFLNECPFKLDYVLLSLAYSSQTLQTPAQFAASGLQPNTRHTTVIPFVMQRGCTAMQIIQCDGIGSWWSPVFSMLP